MRILLVIECLWNNEELATYKEYANGEHICYVKISDDRVILKIRLSSLSKINTDAIFVFENEDSYLFNYNKMMHDLFKKLRSEERRDQSYTRYAYENGTPYISMYILLTLHSLNSNIL